MKKTVKQTLAFLLAAMMIFALCACGETNVEETAAPEFVYKADYQKLAPMENGANFYPRYASENGFYALIDVKVGERELEEGEILEYQGQLDVYESRLFHMDFDGNITELTGYRPYKAEALEGHDIYTNSRALVEKDGGGFLEMLSVSDSWFDEATYARLKGLTMPLSLTDIVYDDDYSMCWHYENAYLLRTLDDKGAAQSSVKLDVTAVVEEAGYDYIDLYSMAQADEGHVLTSGDGGLFLFDITSGAMTGRIDGFEYCDSLLRLNDGRIVASFYGDSGQKLALVDLEGMTKGKEFDAQGELYRMYPGGGDYDVCYNNGVNFIGLDIDAGEKGEAVKLFNWINCDVDNSSVNCVYVKDNEEVIACSTEWDNNSSESTSYLITVHKVSSDSLPQKEVLTFATQNLQWDARSQIIQFNRTHDNIRIELRDYSEFNGNDENSYDAGLTKLRTEMLAGNCPDIIDLNGLPARQMAAKGLLADLYPLIDADPELSREDFFPNVLQAMENNGKLYSTCSSFDVVTAVGDASVVGKEPGWTFAELNAALASQADDCTAFDPYMTRYDVLQTCLMVDLDYFVDWNTGEVRFDSPEFVELLKFSAGFPAEFDWENYEWTREDDENIRVLEGKQLLIRSWLYGFDSLVQYEHVFGGLDGFTFIGLPTSNGVGNMLSPTVGYGICESCRNKEAAWEFIRMYMTEDYQNNNVYEFPSNLNSYQKKVDEAMTVTYYEDENGNVMINPETGKAWEQSKGGYYDPTNDEYVEIFSFSAEEIAKIEEAITSATRVYNYDTTIGDIVSEQVEAFFAGQRSAEDVAKLIQSKVMLYVNEQR